MALGGFSLDGTAPLVLPIKSPTTPAAWSAPPAVSPQTPEQSGATSAARPVRCQDDFAAILDRYPLAFRAGDDDLKSSVARIVDALAELGLQCPHTSIVVTTLSNRALADARAKRLAAQLRSRGLVVEIRTAPNDSKASLRLSLAERPQPH